jgi:hypothetical protein
MKSLAVVLIPAVLSLVGCDSISSRMSERFAGVPTHTRVFAADQKTVYYAAQTALRNVGLLLGRSSPAQGSIDGYAPIRSASATSDARQTTIEIRLLETESGETRVDVLVWEHSEGRFPGTVSEQAQRDHSLYEAYYAALQQVLQNRDKSKRLGKS